MTPQPDPPAGDPLDWSSTSVLVTGGTGSFGRKFAEYVLAEKSPRKLIIFSRDEMKQHEMRSAGLDGPNVRYFLGDVRDADRLRRAMHGVDVVVHAAALKQVPACEYNPFEAVQTNVVGSRNVIDAALDTGVGRVIALSSDKAVNPVNLYGATKLVAEKLFVHANSYVGDGPTRFACCRYGNVVGSRGSVVPLFQSQRGTGRLTVTDERMTRFWLALEQCVRFVIDCFDRMRGGEVFVPKIPSMRVVDLARAIAPECDLAFIGIRPGEKLHEMLLSQDESRNARDYGTHFVVGAPDHDWNGDARALPLPDGYAYTSDDNDAWLSVAQLQSLIDTRARA